MHFLPVYLIIIVIIYYKKILYSYFIIFCWLCTELINEKIITKIKGRGPVTEIWNAFTANFYPGIQKTHYILLTVSWTKIEFLIDSYGNAPKIGHICHYK